MTDYPLLKIRKTLLKLLKTKQKLWPRMKQMSPVNSQTICMFYQWTEYGEGADAHMFGSTVTGRRAHAPEDLYWVLRSLKHHLRPQRQGHYIINLPEERGVERRGARRSSLKGRERAIVNWTNIWYSAANETPGTVLGTQWSACGPSWARKVHLELNWIL